MKFNKISQKLKKKLNDSKGMALLATLIFTFVISTLAIALLTMTNNETKLTTLQKESSEAFYLADSGISRAINWLEIQASPPGESIIQSNNILNGTKWIDSEDEDNKYDLDATLSPGQYYKIEMTLPTGIGSYRAYKIISTGKLVGPRNATRVIEQLVDVTNFAEYAYFSNHEGDNIWFYDGDTIDGRLHTNGQLRIDGSPTFKGLVTSATEPIIWGNNEPHFEIFDVNGYRLGADEYIPLPEKTEDISGTDNPYSLESIAMGSWTVADLPSENGVYIPHDGNDSTGGIYVKGNLNELSLTTENGLSKIIFKQRPFYTTITTTITTLPAGSVDPYDGTPVTSDKTVIREGTDDPIYYDGLTNGLLYVNGGIDSLEATESNGGLQGKLTIAATNDITITNDIKYKSLIDHPGIDIHDDDADLSLVTDTLGLISENDIVLNTSNYITDLEIHATLMALGDSMRNEDYQLSSYYKDTGILTIFGGLIQAKRGPVGTFDSWTGEISTGYGKDYNFDERMNDPASDAVPPFFPTTGNYEPIYWMESN